MRYKQLYSFSNFVRKNTDIKFSVRRCKISNYGECTYSSKKRQFNIKIDSRLTEAFAIDVLIHEIAHCISWDKETDVNAHSSHWGRAYSKIYRLWLEWLEV